PAGASAARRARSPCGTTSWPMPSPAITARRRVVAGPLLSAGVVLMGCGLRFCGSVVSARMSVDQVDGVDRMGADGLTDPSGQVTVDRLVEVQDDQGDRKSVE